jgi:hypothetical protein
LQQQLIADPAFQQRPRDIHYLERHHTS